MKTVHIRKTDFMDKVSANRDAHRNAFERALDGYERRLVGELETRVADVRAGRRIDRHIRLPEPSDHTKDYDRILAMADMSVDDIIELSSDDFSRFVMDQWDWKQDFVETTAYYDRGH